MELIKKISVLLFIISLSLCTTEEKAKAKNPLGKFEGTWRTIENNPDIVITIVFNDEGECSFTIPGLEAITLTPVEEFKFTDKQEYIAYIYKFVTELKSESVVTSHTGHIILWSDGKIMRRITESFPEEGLQDLKEAVKSMKSTDPDIQVEFAKKESQSI